MTEKPNVAIVGATGLVGETILTLLSERNFPVGTLHPIAGGQSKGKTVQFGDQTLDVEPLSHFNFADVDIAFFAAGEAVSEEYVPIAVDGGCVVIDNTACFRYDKDVPLVVPEVNPARVADYTQRRIISNPNCSTIQMVVALKPLHDAFGITRINVATYQSVSGSGRKGIEELVHQVGELLNGRPVSANTFPQQIAFNVFPHIDEFQDNGYTREEMKMLWETRKIFEDDSILVNATTVRVPVLYGHAEAIHLEMKSTCDVDAARELLQAAPGIQVVDNLMQELYPTPLHDVVGCDDVLVGRIRKDISHPLGLNLWVVADNVRKGAATNAVQIAEILQRDYL